MADSLPLSLTVIHSLCQHSEFSEGLLEGGVVWVGGGSVLEQVFNEEDIARNSLNGFD